MYLSKILCLLYFFKKQENDKEYINKVLKSNENNKIINNINWSLLTNGIYLHFVDLMFTKKVVIEKINKFLKSYIKEISSKKNRSFLRIGLISGSKWYLKKYSDNAAFKKIITSIIGDTIDELNKNLKSTANKYIKMGKK
jgi:hypothetical protein